MTNVNTQLLQVTRDGVIYADPTDPDFTVRFKTTSNPKSLNGVNTINYVTEIIINDNEDVVVSGINASDALSVRIRVSGSIESQTRLQEIVRGVASQLDAWLTENTLLGFQPVTVPVNPHA